MKQSPKLFDVTKRCQNKWGIFFKYVWPSQNILTLPKSKINVTYVDILCARLLFLVVISNDGMLKSPASSIQAEHDIFILPRHCTVVELSTRMAFLNIDQSL